MSQPSAPQLPDHLILFDGVCNLCNTSVHFVIDRDSSRTFRYASLQSALGQSIQERFGRNPQQIDSVVYVENGRYYDRSTAALKIARHLDGFWRWLYVFILIPPMIRNVVYDWIGRNRYRWFGKQDACRMPTPELRALFVD